jgi:hypothetical protein
MQTKSYYRLLKWTLMACVTASLATACVVTTGDGDDDDSFFDGGESSTSTSGKTSTGGAGSSAVAGTTSGGAGTSAGGTTAAGTGGTSAGAGGDAPVPGVDSGLCQGDDNPSPTSLPSCAPDAKDEKDACRKCQRASCCTEWQTCYGSDPLTACGWGFNRDDDGQFDCIKGCYARKVDTSSDDEATIKEDCSFECLNQCESDSLVTDATNALTECVTTNCDAECFPPPM